MLHASEKICQSIAPPRKHNKFPGSHGINWEKEVRTGKTKYLPVEEALSKPLSLNKKGNPLNIIGPSRVVTTKSMAIGTRGSFSTSGAQNSNSFPAKSPLQRLLGSARYTNPQNVKNTKIVEQIKNTVQSSKGSGELKSPGAANESPLMNPIMTHPCDPALAHSWKRKVYEFSRLLLGSLKFELVPRGAIWTSLFNNHFPGKQDTGLYFLASERERSEIYPALVEYLRKKDSVMRMLINDVELVLITKSLIRMNTTRAI
ncbi:hypothetical protein T459_10348 [Capsicum annuum]|uniref:AIPP2-like SPOC-like domain-containing protein n=1 Tax=Capsicum annuum TaxID=4072 RepID=A0A2G3A200_CAPAN|nr:hypothetical protein T459_10348 [Capsicum annuum]